MEEVLDGLVDAKQGLELQVASKDRVINELRRQVDEEKANAQRLREEKLKLEFDLALFDAAVEDLQTEVEEKTRSIKELEGKDTAATKIIDELQVKGEVKSRYMVVVFSVALTLAAVLLSIYAKRS